MIFLLHLCLQKTLSDFQTLWFDQLNLKLWLSRWIWYKNHSKSMAMVDDACFDHLLFPQKLSGIGDNFTPVDRIQR